MRYQIASKLSEHMATTPEGYLLCLDVPIARTGVQQYAPDEVPFEADGPGPVSIERHPDDVFDPLTMASFEGKPVTVDHPDEDVTPANWRDLAVGHAQAVRRGEGVQSDLLLADLLITDKEAIRLIRGGLREISCGYDADYEPGESGRWMQRMIRGNHVALVRRGRCGPRCMINDNRNREDGMKHPKKQSVMDRLLAAMKSPKARRALDEALAGDDPEKKPDDEEKKPDDPGREATGDDDVEERLAALEASVEEMKITLRQIVKGEASEGQGATDEEGGAEGGEETDDDEQDPGVATDEDESTKTGDRARVRARDARVVDADTRARAVLLHPGIRIADGDRDCAVKRASLRAAMGDKALGPTIRATLRGGTLDKCDCVTLDAAFVAASEVAKVRNNGRTADALGKATVKDFGKPVTPASINEANAKFYDARRK